MRNFGLSNFDAAHRQQQLQQANDLFTLSSHLS